ncbi:hypothetical protein KM043_018546 [Ampulex compressa]|nr:hypothetical protein KM043_018546 [Ampulex compressa]
MKDINLNDLKHVEAIEQEGITPIKKIIEIMGKWPILTPLVKYKSRNNWRKIDQHFSKLKAKPIFFDIDLSLTDHYTLVLSPPKLLLPPNILVSGKEIFLRSHYRDMISQTVKLFVKEEQSETYKDALSEKISALLQFEIELADIISNKRKSPTTYFTTIGEFQKLYDGKLDLMVSSNTEYVGSCLLLLSRRLIPKNYEGITEHHCTYTINWLEEIRNIFDIQGTDLLHIHTPIIVKNLEYFVRLCRFLEKSSEEVIVNYIYWNVVRSLMPFVNKETKKILFNASFNLGWNYYEIPQRWRQCLRENAMKNIVFAETIKKHFSGTIDEKALDIFNAIELEIKRSFMKPLNISGDTEQVASTVFDKKELRFKAPKSLLDSKRILQTPIESNVSFNYMDQVLSNMRYSAMNKLLMTFHTIDVDRNMDPWSPKISSVINDIADKPSILNYPVGSMQYPFFDIALPDAYLFGTIGTQIAQHSSEIINQHSE